MAVFEMMIGNIMMRVLATDDNRKPAPLPSTYQYVLVTGTLEFEKLRNKALCHWRLFGQCKKVP